MSNDDLISKKQILDILAPRPMSTAPRNGCKFMAYSESLREWHVVMWLVGREEFFCISLGRPLQVLDDLCFWLPMTNDLQYEIFKLKGVGND